MFPKTYYETTTHYTVASDFRWENFHRHPFETAEFFFSIVNMLSEAEQGAAVTNSLKGDAVRALASVADDDYSMSSMSQAPIDMYDSRRDMTRESPDDFASFLRELVKQADPHKAAVVMVSLAQRACPLKKARTSMRPNIGDRHVQFPQAEFSGLDIPWYERFFSTWDQTVLMHQKTWRNIAVVKSASLHSVRL